jgi:predicted PurR-regulated permease PerM
MDSNIKKFLLYSFLAAAALIAVYFIYILSDLVIILVISILFSFIFNPFIKFIERSGVNRLFSTLILFISFFILVYLVLSFIIPKFIFQMNALLVSMKDYSIHDEIIRIESEIYKLLPFFTPGEFSRKLENFLTVQFLNSFDFISPVLSSMVSLITLLVIIPFISFFLLKDSNHIIHSLINLLPNRYFEMSYWIIKKVTNQLGRYVRAWIFDASFVGITMGFGLYFLGIQYSLPLGVIAGLGHLIPYFGPIIGGIPAIIISIIQFGDLSQVPFIALLLLVIYTLDNGFVQPYIFSKSLDIHPIFIILLIIAGGQLFGLLGMMLIIPTTTVIKTAVKEIYFAFKNYKIARL